VPTPEIQQVEKAVDDYAATFDQPSDQPNPLLLAARGDFGTGKTHLMLYAREELNDQILKRYPINESAPWDSRTPLTVLTVCSEAPIEDWYATDLGPAMMEACSPRELVRELLTRIAIDVARADPDPDIQSLASEFRASRKALYQSLRHPDDFDLSAVNQRFADEIAKLCPRTSIGFRRMIAALRWEETADVAEDWLSGNDIESSDLARIGAHSEASPSAAAARAANAICAVAALSRRLNRPFVLMLDEFEHLARFDRRNSSKRNITWVKRLVESLARRGAMVFICGHWDAWDQQDDFLDRFAGRRPIQLVRLGVEDIRKVVTVRAGKEAWPGFTDASAAAVIRDTSGNIRRVMTVLYDLWGDGTAPETPVTAGAVRAAVHRRLDPGTEPGIIPTIEKAIANAGGGVYQGELAGDPPWPLDGVFQIAGEPRLVVLILHARDELQLINGGIRFARYVQNLRTDYQYIRGLCVTLGAVVDEQVSTLDAAFLETDIINGEQPKSLDNLSAVVTHALNNPDMELKRTGALPQQALVKEHEEALERATARSARGSRAFQDNALRTDALRADFIDPTEELTEASEEIQRQRMFEILIMNAKRSLFRGFPSEILKNPTIPIAGALGVNMILFSNEFVNRLESYISTMHSDISITMLKLLYFLINSLGSLMVIAAAIWSARLFWGFREFQNAWTQALHRLAVTRAPADILEHQNEKFEFYLSSLGPIAGLRKIMDGRLGKHLNQEPAKAINIEVIHEPTRHR
jgi:hypothetical protein